MIGLHLLKLTGSFALMDIQTFIIKQVKPGSQHMSDTPNGFCPWHSFTLAAKSPAPAGDPALRAEGQQVPSRLVPPLSYK